MDLSKFNINDLQTGQILQTPRSFTMVSNDIIEMVENKEMSRDAYFMYVLIQKYITIPNFKLNKTFIHKKYGGSETTFDKYWKELKDLNLLIQYKFNKKQNTGFIYLYELLEKPNKIKAEKSHSCAISTKSEKSTLSDSGDKKTIPQKLGSEGVKLKKTRPQNLRPENLRPEKMGSLINTNINNTNINNTNTITTRSQSEIGSKRENPNKDMVEAYTNLKLTPNMSNQVLALDSERLKKTIDIFNNQDGVYFSLLMKIYKDEGNFTSASGATKSSTYKKLRFNNFKGREYDYAKLERELLGWDKQ